MRSYNRLSHDEVCAFLTNAEVPVRNLAVITAGAFPTGQDRALRCQGGSSLQIAQITMFPSSDTLSAGA